MKIIQNNPYRKVGLLAGSTAREQTRQISRLKKYIEAEQEPKDDFSFPILGNLQRSLNDVEEATSKLILNSDKINAALFWFWNGNPITDEAAFDALKSGDIETASEIWDKLITRTDKEGNRFWKPITEKNYSAFHNCSILNIINANGNLHNGIVANLYFLESNLVQKFISTVADETHITDKKELQLSFLNQLLSDIEENKKTSLPKFLEILNKHEFVAKLDFMKGFVQKPIEQIEHKIEAAKKKRKANKANASKAGQELFTATANDLTQLETIVGSNDIKYMTVADKVANEILQCSIDYFNDSQEKDRSSDYIESAMRLAKQADAIAVGKLTKDRVKDSIETLSEMKDREITQAIQLLQSVKDAYETNDKQIRADVRKLEETDVQIKMGYRSINWIAVEENIKNSINWQEVNKLLISILSDINLKKIKESDEIEAKKEFWELLNWTKENSLKSSTVSNIIEKYKSIPPNLCFEILSSEITNTGNKAFYVEDIRYVGLCLKIKATGAQRVALYRKYINPEGKYSHSKSSPEGYTTSEIITIKPETKEINLAGWGNEEKCTYIVGEHKIEVYVEHYKVYTKTFQVDWSPSKKSELTKNIGLLQNELNEVEKFQWFRSGETKHKQASEVEDKIKKAKQILMNK